MYRSLTRTIAIPWIATILLSGCDEQTVEIAREAADRQAQQNVVMAELQKEVATGTKRMVEADAQARKEVVGVHRDLQAERSRLDSGWNDLEDERRQIAGQRRTESVLVPVIQTAGVFLLVALVLGFSWYVIVQGRYGGVAESDVSELLLDELLANQPTLLIAEGGQPPLLERSEAEGTSEN
jgi:hypothetical protein